SGDQKVDFNDILVNQGKEALQETLKIEHQTNVMEKMLKGPLKGLMIEENEQAFLKSIEGEQRAGYLEVFKEEADEVLEKYPEHIKEVQALGYHQHFSDPQEEKVEPLNLDLKTQVQHMKELLEGPLEDFFGKEVAQTYMELAENGQAAVVLGEFKEDCE